MAYPLYYVEVYSNRRNKGERCILRANIEEADFVKKIDAIKRKFPSPDYDIVLYKKKWCQTTKGD